MTPRTEAAVLHLGTANGKTKRQLRTALDLSRPLDAGLAARLRARLAAKTAKSADGCWLWTGYKKNALGHGALYVGEDFVFVHRLAYALDRGPIPDGMKVCHTCDVPNCVQPEHFFLGSQQDNVADANRKGRAKRPPKMTGEQHPNATLTDEQVAEIRRRWAAKPRGQRQLAAEFGVSQWHLSNIIHNKSRKPRG